MGRVFFFLGGEGGKKCGVVDCLERRRIFFVWGEKWRWGGGGEESREKNFGCEWLERNKEIKRKEGGMCKG